MSNIFDDLKTDEARPTSTTTPSIVPDETLQKIIDSNLLFEEKSAKIRERRSEIAEEFKARHVEV